MLASGVDGGAAAHQGQGYGSDTDLLSDVFDYFNSVILPPEFTLREKFGFTQQDQDGQQFLGLRSQYYAHIDPLADTFCWHARLPE